MKKDIFTITQYKSLKEAKTLMKEHNINGLPIIEQKKLIGLITSKDIYNK